VIKYFLIFLIFFLNNCSFSDRAGIWSQNESLETSNPKIKILFEKEEITKDEFNTNFLVKTPLKLIKKQQEYETNNNGFLNKNLNFDKISRYKFSKIDSFDYFDPTLVFYKNDLIFFDNKGSILRFDDNSKIIWKKNYYSKIEKKTLPILNFSINNKTLIVTDSLSKYYAIDLETGEMMWSRNHNTVFISEIKIDNDKFYVIDSNNVINCFSIKDGSNIWEFKSEFELIKSQKKLSIVFDEQDVYFNNSTGNLYSLNKDNGNLVWVTPTKDTDNFFESFLFKTSKILLDNDQLFFSNNQNSFFSLDKKSGFINWKNNINSETKPIVVENIIFTVSTEGLFFVIDKVSGNILRITNIFNQFKKKKREKIRPIGIILDPNKAYISLNNGKIIVVNISNGKTESIFKIAKGKISPPFINQDYMFIVKDNEIIKLN
jgi:outer membrane protein assembly factor BamB